ncbi:probable G-protein coupled receptor 148 [Narcine bancroftii]|uniref:probable G-protein coupled receptor 148 n=1 Tax=Narcine bancroftii TaxID=1343680 RepID=UPI0038310C62
MNVSQCEHCDSYSVMSLLGQEMVTLQFSSNISHTAEFQVLHNLVQKSFLIMSERMNGLVIPLVICLFASLLATPLVLMAIFINSSLRQETRYLLLANTMLNDLIYSVLNTLITILNAVGIGIPKVVCEMILFTLTVAYSNGILTITAMVVDTYVAVGWPLRYSSLLSHYRTIKIIACIWIISVSSSSLQLVIMLGTQKDPFSLLMMCVTPLVFLNSPFGTFLLKCSYGIVVLYFLICLVLILSFYIMLYYKTKTLGIWVNNSRAKLTYLIHSVLLMVYFSPLIVLVAGGVIYGRHPTEPQSAAWIIVSVNDILMLPKAVSPYVYGLRYREIASTIRSFFTQKSITQVRPL